jgi:hypothetical protein
LRQTFDEVLQLLVLYIDAEAEVTEEFTLHLVDLGEGEEPLTDDGPALVGVGVIALHLACQHQSGDEEAVAGRATGSWEARLEPLQEEKGMVGDYGRQACAVQSVGDEL